MATRNFDSKKAGSQEQNEPRLLGSIVEEMLHGSSALAKGYRQYIASLENGEAGEQVRHTNTDLGCDVKTNLCSDRKMKVGKKYVGVLTLESEGIVDEFVYRDSRYEFFEIACPTAGKRNPHVYVGKYITVTCRPDGTLHLNFKELPADMRVERYALGVYNEICMALGGRGFAGLVK